MVTYPSPRQVLDELVADLHATVQLRTWSVIVSVFGDTALQRGSRIKASALIAILEPLGIEAGAMRTALSRLAKDGWVESHRSGRTSTYQLTSSALSASGVASRAIYGRKRPASDTSPQLIMSPDGSELPDDPRVLPLRRGIALWQAQTSPRDLLKDILSAKEISAPIPDWVRNAVVPAGLADQMRELIVRFQPLRTCIAENSAPAAVDSVSARVALIHAWRRLALRLPKVPAAFLPDEWPEPECRKFVLALHKDLSRRADPWLDAYLNDEQGNTMSNMSQNFS